MAVLTKEQIDAMRKAIKARAAAKIPPASEGLIKDDGVAQPIKPKPISQPSQKADSLDNAIIQLVEVQEDTVKDKEPDGQEDRTIPYVPKEEQAITLVPVEVRTTLTHDTRTARRQAWKNNYESEEQIVSPAIKRKTYTGKIEINDIPRSIQELIEMLEDSAFHGRNSHNVIKALQRLPDNFERTMWDNPEVVCPGTYLEIETNGGKVKYSFGSDPFKHHEQMMYSMFVILPTGDARFALAYLSNSQAAWRIMPDITLDKRYDKGLMGENAYTLPYEVQVVLDRLSLNIDMGSLREIRPENLITSPPDDYNNRGINHHGRLVQDIGQTIIFIDKHPHDLPKIEEGPKSKLVPYVGKVEYVDSEGIKKFFDGFPSARWPAFDQNKTKEEMANSPIYGRFFRAAILSNDEGIRYVFNITADGVFFASIEDPLSDINKYGVHEKPIATSFPQDIMMPKCEYLQQFKVGMQPGRLIGRYAVVNGLHDTIPLLLEAERFFYPIVCELKNINKR